MSLRHIRSDQLVQVILLKSLPSRTMKVTFYEHNIQIKQNMEKDVEKKIERRRRILKHVDNVS